MRTRTCVPRFREKLDRLSLERAAALLEQKSFAKGRRHVQPTEDIQGNIEQRRKHRSEATSTKATFRAAAKAFQDTMGYEDVVCCSFVFETG